jgi:hypothetical protein
MSPMLSSGLVGVSTQITLVFGRIAARTASTLDTWAGVYSMPQSESTLSTSRKVPPYASSGITRWSPGRSVARSTASVAAMPEANARPNRPPSSAARHSSSAVRVGLPVREYSYPARMPPTPSWA